MTNFEQAKPSLEFQLLFEGSWPMAVAFLDNGKYVAAGNQLGQLLLWDLSQPPAEPPSDPKAPKQPAPNIWPVRQCLGHTNGIARLEALPDGQTLLSASLDHTLGVWSLATATAGSAELVLDADSREAQSRRTGKKEISTAPSCTVATQSPVKTLTGHDDWVQALALSRDGKRAISGDNASRVIVWDTANWQEVSRWSGLPWNWIVSLALSADGQKALVSEVRYKRDDFDVPAAALRLYQTADGKELLDLLKVQFPKYNAQDATYGGAQTWRKFVAAGLVAADISPDGKILAVGQGGETDTGKVHLLDAENGKLLRDVSGHQYGLTDLRFTADGQFLLSVGRDTTLRIIRVADGKELAALNSPRGGQFKDWLSAVAISADEKRLAAADIAGLVHVWKLDG